MTFINFHTVKQECSKIFEWLISDVNQLLALISLVDLRYLIHNFME